MAWQKAAGCGRRSLGETAVGRYKRLVGPKLRARGLPGQRAEAALALQVLNRMIRAAKPVPVRVTRRPPDGAAAYRPTSTHQRPADGDRWKPVARTTRVAVEPARDGQQASRASRDRQVQHVSAIPAVDPLGGQAAPETDTRPCRGPRRDERAGGVTAGAAASI
jgi:hypothetical protein